MEKCVKSSNERHEASKCVQSGNLHHRQSMTRRNSLLTVRSSSQSVFCSIKNVKTTTSTQNRYSVVKMEVSRKKYVNTSTNKGKQQQAEIAHRNYLRN